MDLYDTSINAYGRADDYLNKIKLIGNTADELEHKNILINNHIFYVTSIDDTATIVVLNKNISEEDLNWAK